MSAKRKICAVVTARPSYSRIKTALRAIDQHEGLELQLVVAASALLGKYGLAISYIEEDGFKVNARVFNMLEGENLTASAKTTGIGILELSSVFENLKPDIVITVADRYETMATAIAASYMNIPLAHVQGGEVTGNIDEKVRHAITKLADYHLVASENAMKRVIKLGEEPHFVFNTGCPSIDLAKEVKNNPELDFDPYQKYGGVGKLQDLENGYYVVMQHPVTTEHSEAREHVQITLEAMRQVDKPVLWFWPNVDAGADGISNGIRSFREQNPDNPFHFFKNMEPQDFLRLLCNATALIGNSSVGIRECSYLGVPVVNIGRRQNGRDRGANVVDVDYDGDQILRALETLNRSERPAPSSVYGGGEAGLSIAQILSEVELRYDKTITY